MTTEMRQKAENLRNQNRWSMEELAGILGVPLGDLLHDFDLRRREIEAQDE